MMNQGRNIQTIDLEVQQPERSNGRPATTSSTTTTSLDSFSRMYCTNDHNTSPTNVSVGSNNIPFSPSNRNEQRYQVPPQEYHDPQNMQQQEVVTVPSQPIQTIQAQQLRSKSRKDDHIGMSRQYWRDIILGVNDGIVSTFLLVVGVIGGGLNDDTKIVLLTAISSSIAGAISMFAGEYLATKSQNEVLTGEIILEKEHIRTNLLSELNELDYLFELIGISPTATTSTTDSSIPNVCVVVMDNRNNNNSSSIVPVACLKEQLYDFYKDNPDSLLKLMKALEFGIVDDEIRSPMAAGLVSCSLFIIGSLSSILPFACTDNVQYGLYGAIILTILALIIIGTIKTWASRSKKWFQSPMENVIIACAGGGIAYFIGKLFETFVVNG